MLTKGVVTTMKIDGEEENALLVVVVNKDKLIGNIGFGYGRPNVQLGNNLGYTTGSDGILRPSLKHSSGNLDLLGPVHLGMNEVPTTTFLSC
ncbi:hypothetical protein L1987_69098 [Smallanthus sonchifolius]|uniref:Uncharacterized protein n=1 Tax=Smallanthus sonchifolius TaxID=185202 RepID=A0ACB9B5W3_9ASTR|nr:hypothetical protein L1987_69098 [Smallanthus sonchifolius]